MGSKLIEKIFEEKNQTKEAYLIYRKKYFTQLKKRKDVMKKLDLTFSDKLIIDDKTKYKTMIELEK